MTKITQEIEKLLEYQMTQPHKEAIARARRGDHHSPSTKAKISRSMDGKKNHLGKKHTNITKDVIGAKRGSRDPIRGRSWIVNQSGKTYRRYHAPQGFKQHKRVYESLLSFKNFL